MSKREKSFGLSLIAIAWLGMILITVYAIGVYQFAVFTSGQHLSGLPADWKLPVWKGSNTIYLGCLWVGQIWVLWQLRGIGSRLETQPGISAQVALAFRWLAHSLLALTVIGMALPTPHMLDLPNNPWMVVVRFDFQTAFELAIACLCAYTTAHLLEESARLRRENEAFV